MIYRWLVLIILLHAPMTFAQDRYPFESPAQQSQFTHLLSQLRCLVCQNQDLADSNAPLAEDLREEVYQLVLKGESDGDIMRYLTQRFGDFILFKPPVKGSTFLLWSAPVLFMCVGFFLMWWLCFRRRSNE